MITQQYRPKTFKEVAGQKHVIDTLKCIIKNPEVSPRTIILQGAYGTGKTTIARIFARALNCYNQVNGEPCGNCPVCNSDLDMSPFYEEYDSAVVGNIDQIRSLKETFYYNSDRGYKIIVLDECHLISKPAQAALLKVFEETKGNIFFVLCTTDVQALLPTIRSRSLELVYNTISSKDLKENLKTIAEKEHINIDDETLELIISRSEGHARNAHMLLDRYQLMGETFKNTVRSADKDIAQLLKLCVLSNYYKNLSRGNIDEEKKAECLRLIETSKAQVADQIYKLQNNTLSTLKIDYENTVLAVIKSALGIKQSEIPEINEVAKYISNSKEMFLKYYDILTQDSILNSFKSDKMFQAAMWLLYISL